MQEANINFYEKPFPHCLYSFVEGVQLRTRGIGSEKLHVEFIDQKTNRIVKQGDVSVGEMMDYQFYLYIDWRIRVHAGSKLILDYRLDLSGQRVIIKFNAPNLGDTIAWIPYVEEFRKRHKCHVICSTSFNHLFKQTYPEIEFVPYGVDVPNIYAMYTVGCWHPLFAPTSCGIVWTTLSVTGMAKIQLGLDDLPDNLKAKLFFNDLHPRQPKTITIATEASMRSKFWNNRNGWPSVVKWLIKSGYRVINVSRYGAQFDGMTTVADDESLDSVCSYIKNSDLFIGLPSGLSWVAWAVSTPVVMISGISESWCEFPCLRVSPPPGKCRGCHHRYVCDVTDWSWCPDNKYFECTRSITANMVKQKVKEALAGVN